MPSGGPESSFNGVFYMIVSGPALMIDMMISALSSSLFIKVMIFSAMGAVRL